MINLHNADCLNTNRNFIGIEIDKNYFETAKTRLISQKKVTFKLTA